VWLRVLELLELRLGASSVQALERPPRQRVPLALQQEQALG
jgi:hypothetical protein